VGMGDLAALAIALALFAVLVVAIPLIGKVR
jgi:hypothetical protein